MWIAVGVPKFGGQAAGLFKLVSVFGAAKKGGVDASFANAVGIMCAVGLAE